MMVKYRKIPAASDSNRRLPFDVEPSRRDSLLKVFLLLKYTVANRDKILLTEENEKRIADDWSISAMDLMAAT
jgi:hypothetical protein